MNAALNLSTVLAFEAGQEEERVRLQGRIAAAQALLIGLSSTLEDLLEQTVSSCQCRRVRRGQVDECGYCRARYWIRAAERWGKRR